jgi:peptidoglycan/xylan/chitin deacetylase (PgdA/CDA1 family)
MRWLNKRPSKEPKALVLVYHRVAENSIDPWRLCVQPEVFEQQIQFLKNNFHVISIDNLKEQLAKRQISDRTVCITFDDGYVDNYTTAWPILSRNNLPATFFITSHNLNNQQSFWWDELVALSLQAPMLPECFILNVGDFHFTFDLGQESILSEEMISQHQSWYYTMSPPTKRCSLYYSLWEKLKPLPLNKIENILDAIRQINNSKTINNYALMSECNILEMINDPLFSIGIHTETHPALAYHNISVQKKEIENCKTALEAIVHQSVEAISYPYGNYNKDTLAVCVDSNLSLGFTTEEKCISKNSDPLRLGRVTIESWKEKEFEDKLEHFFKGS